MNFLRVWAPDANRLETLVRRHSRLLMKKEADGARGWWSVSDPEIGSGADYGFITDGKDQFLPDPRTRFQPEGIHGPSRVVEDVAFHWTDQDFVASPFSDALIYELHIGTFSPEGTFDAAVEHLDHLVELGITPLELMPVAEFSGSRGWSLTASISTRLIMGMADRRGSSVW